MACITAWRFRDELCDNWEKGAFNIGALSLTILTTVATCADSKRWVNILTVAHCVFNIVYLLTEPQMMPKKEKFIFDGAEVDICTPKVLEVEGEGPNATARDATKEEKELFAKNTIYNGIQSANRWDTRFSVALTSIRIFQIVRYEGFN